MVRQAIGLALAVIGVWLCYEVSRAISAYVVRGVPLAEAVIDPAFLLRIVGGLTIAIGGLLALLSRAGGALLAGVGLVVFLVLTAAIVASGGDQSIWLDEAIVSAITAVLFIGLLTIRRER